MTFFKDFLGILKRMLLKKGFLGTTGIIIYITASNLQSLKCKALWNIEDKMFIIHSNNTF